jgi:SsrA-binding protein
LKAYHNYTIIDEYDAGIVLVGSEVKSIKLGKANFSDSFCKFINNELYLVNLHVSEYEQAIEPHDVKRDRKLLLTKRELKKLQGKLQDDGITIVPLKIYFKNGFIKVKIATAKGKKNYDKRESLKTKDLKRSSDIKIKA